MPGPAPRASVERSMANDKNAQLRNLIAGYGDSIRLSDIKAMIAVLFVAIMMGTVIQFHELYPWYLSVPVILTPFTIIFLNLLISVYRPFCKKLNLNPIVVGWVKTIYLFYIYLYDWCNRG
jgi:hypothetical protein